MNDPEHIPPLPGEPTPLGDPRVDAAVSSLQDLDKRSVDDHPAVFEQAHERLREALDDDGSSSADTSSQPR